MKEGHLSKKRKELPISRDKHQKGDHQKKSDAQNVGRILLNLKRKKNKMLANPGYHGQILISPRSPSTDLINKAWGERDRLLKQQQITQEENLARELERVNFEQLCDEKMQQQIRETSLELRELEAKLRAAYTNKERAAQIAERESMKYDEMKRESEIARHMKEQNERAEEAEHLREMERYKEMARYQQELERQLEKQEAQKQQAYEQFLKEKLMIDEIVSKICEEYQRELERQLQKRQVTQQYIEEFKRAREEWKLQEKRKMEEENQRILHFARQMQEREEHLKSQKKEKDSAMSKVQDAMLAKFAEDDRLEQMNAQRRRMKQLEHQRAVEKLLEDRRVQFAHEREAEVEARLEEAKLEQFRKIVIEKERQKLLKEHAIKLLGFLPRTLFNPNKTVVKMFVVMYDLSDMPASSQTFIRQRTVYSPTDNNSTAPSFLRYLIHLRCASSRSGKIYLHTDIRLIFARHKLDIDAKNIAYELKSFTEGPSNPKYSPKK